MTFAYPNADAPVLKGISFESRAGEITAVIGSPGCGKSSILKLIPRMYDTLFGEVYVDGINVRDYKVSELRELIGYVPQKNELVEAARSAQADGFIRTLPDSYNMVLSKDAENISQGERQLLTIARTIASDPEIMILDEATSNVDTHTELIIQTAMARLMKGRTSFVIAHRLSTIRDADMILYMKNGDIKEAGDHDELLKQNGKYAVLYNSQFA